MSKSQFNQDKLILGKLLKNKRNGIFLDVGAYDGKTLSNTYYMEKELGWTGICIEPIYDRFQELKANRENSICINACAYNQDTVLPFYYITGYAEMLSGIYTSYTKRDLDRINRESSEENRKVINVNTVQIKNLLEKHKISEVDYISVDVEGSELQVLEGIDFDKVKFQVLDIENNHVTDTVAKFLFEKGYKKIGRIGCDDIFIPISCDNGF